VNGRAARPFEENGREPFQVFHEEHRMTTTDRDLPAATRAESEIDFVLRRAKWRSGPEVLRDVARAQSAAGESADDGPNRAHAGHKSARAKTPKGI